MPTIKSCLLVSEDPDDHQILSEAMKSVNANIVLIILLESNNVVQLLQQAHVKPDLIIIDAQMEGFTNEQLAHTLDDPALQSIPIILYADSKPTLNHFSRTVHTLSKRLTYSEICTSLQKLAEKWQL